MTISRNLSILAEGVSSSGVLGAANGGTGQSAALTQYGVVYGSSSTAMAITAAGTTGQVLVATTSGAPSWERFQALPQLLRLALVRPA